MLYECPTCGREVSGNANTCPKCGEPDVGKKAMAYYSAVIRPVNEKARRERQEIEERCKRKNRSGVIGGLLGALAGGCSLGFYLASSPNNYCLAGLGFVIGAFICWLIGYLIGETIG